MLAVPVRRPGVARFHSGFLFLRQSTKPSWTFLRALVSSSHCSVLCAAVGYQVGITSYAALIAFPGSCWMHVLRQFTKASDDCPHFLREGGPHIPRSGALLAHRWFDSGHMFCVRLGALERIFHVQVVFGS